MVENDSVNKMWKVYIDEEINNGENRLYFMVEETVTGFLRSIVYPENYLEPFKVTEKRYFLKMNSMIGKMKYKSTCIVYGQDDIVVDFNPHFNEEQVKFIIKILTHFIFDIIEIQTEHKFAEEPF